MEKRFTYDAEFKRKVILCAEEIGNRAAGKRFKVDEKNVRRWRATKEKLFQCKKQRKSFSGPKRGRYPAIEAVILTYIKELRSKGLPVTRERVMFKAKECAKNSGVVFKASHGWCKNFMKREGLTLRRRTTITQKLPTDYEDKLLSFQHRVINLRKEHKYCFSQIGNADETAIFLDMPRNYTINKIREKQIKILSTGYEKSRITVMLSITADGNKLPPFIILNRKTVPKENFPKGVIIRAQKNARMTTELMKDWLENVWEKRPGASKRSMLVMDAFRGHLTDDIKLKIKAKNCDLVIIPADMISPLQPLDVSVNKPFKDRMRTHYETWLNRDDHPLTPTGKIKQASSATIAQWVLQSWKDIPEESIKKSFLKCCITNDLNGTEDDLLWCNSDDQNSSFESEDIESDSISEEDSQ